MTGQDSSKQTSPHPTDLPARALKAPVEPDQSESKQQRSNLEEVFGLISHGHDQRCLAHPEQPSKKSCGSTPSARRSHELLIAVASA